VVTYVVPSSPAAQAGLRRGDVIVGFGHQPVNSAAQLAQWVRQTRPGSTVSLEFVRNNSTADVPILIGRKTLTAGQGMELARPVPTENAPSADSLLRIVDYLKQEVSRLEGRLDNLR
jgi:C-terminal processing protease CtpA/Prc